MGKGVMNFQTYITKTIKSVWSVLPKKLLEQRSKQTSIIHPSFTNAFLWSTYSDI